MFYTDIDSDHIITNIHPHKGTRASKHTHASNVCVPHYSDGTQSNKSSIYTERVILDRGRLLTRQLYPKNYPDLFTRSLFDANISIENCTHRRGVVFKKDSMAQLPDNYAPFHVRRRALISRRSKTTGRCLRDDGVPETVMRQGWKKGGRAEANGAD